jgi:hypothetical protein
MGTSFAWGFPEDGGIQQNTAPTPGDFEYQVRDALRASQNASTFPPQNASPTAQSDGGLGIQNVRRGFLDLRVAYDSTVVGIDFQTTSTSFTDVSTELTGTMISSGRPVMVVVRGASTGDPCTFTVRVDNREVTGISSGITASAKGDGIWFAQPSAGAHTYAMQWKVASGTALMPRSYRPALTVVEI